MKVFCERSLEDYLKRNLENRIGIISLIDKIRYDYRTDEEIKVLLKEGYITASNMKSVLEYKEKHYSIEALFKNIDIDTKRKLFSISCPFSDRAIKIAVTKMAKEGRLKKKGSSENQIKKGNYFIEKF